MNVNTCKIVRRTVTQQRVGLFLAQHARFQGLASDATSQENNHKKPSHPEKVMTKPKKTIAQIDEELRLKMEGRAGDGGDAGLELEDGKPVSMKRGVRDNMFRYI